MIKKFLEIEIRKRERMKELKSGLCKTIIFTKKIKLNKEK